MINKLFSDYKKMKKDDLIEQLVIKTIILDEIEGYCSMPIEKDEFTSEEINILDGFNKEILGIIKQRKKDIMEDIMIILRGEE